MAEPRRLYVNLAVKDLAASVKFFTELGFAFDPAFTNEDGTAMIVGHDSVVMLLTEEFFKTFTKKDLADAGRTTEAILSISAESREEVDELVHKALRAGGKESLESIEMPGMYGWSFQDLDGHLWEVLFQDLSVTPVPEA